MLIVSNYHYIREDFSAKYPSIFGVMPGQFRKQLEELAKYGEFISAAGLEDFRRKDLDGNYFLITFDDGLKEQFELAKPILDEMGIPFLCFINSSNFQEKEVSLVHKIHLLRSRLSSREILQALQESGSIKLKDEEKALAVLHYNYDPKETAVLKYLLNFKMNLQQQQEFVEPLFRELFNEEKVVSDLYFTEEMLNKLHEQNALGSHSHRHLPLGMISPEELKRELEESQNFFRNSLGNTTKFISYPYGSAEASLGIASEVENAGYNFGFSMERAANVSLREDSLLIARFDCNDLPLGKMDLFKGVDPFIKAPTRKWQLHEDRTLNQQ